MIHKLSLSDGAAVPVSPAPTTCDPIGLLGFVVQYVHDREGAGADLVDRALARHPELTPEDLAWLRDRWSAV